MTAIASQPEGCARTALGHPLDVAFDIRINNGPREKQIPDKWSSHDAVAAPARRLHRSPACATRVAGVVSAVSRVVLSSCWSHSRVSGRPIFPRCAQLQGSTTAQRFGGLDKATPAVMRITACSDAASSWPVCCIRNTLAIHHRPGRLGAVAGAHAVSRASGQASRIAVGAIDAPAVLCLQCHKMSSTS